MKFRFIKLPQYQRFEFQPRFYDPEKEQLESRIAVTASDHAKGEEYKRKLAEAFRERARREREPIFIRLAIIAIITAMLAGLYFWVLGLEGK